MCHLSILLGASGSTTKAHVRLGVHTRNPSAPCNIRKLPNDPLKYSMATISIPEAGSTENLQALSEVSDFDTTDMGRGGPERWTYRKLPEPRLTTELARMANAKSLGSTDVIMFQPCLTYEARCQDRYLVEEWDLPGGKWSFSAVFDGHSLHDNHTVDHVVHELPRIIQASLRSALRGTPGLSVPPETISKILSGAIVNLDNSIRSEFMSLFREENLDTLTDKEIQGMIHASENSFRIVIRCLQGSTVLLSLVDPSRENIWIANLGDSQAVLGLQQLNGEWSGTDINPLHNGDSYLERERIRQEHPGEDGCIQDDRVIGFLAPTRAIGDTWLKLPAKYTTRVFSKISQAWSSPERAKTYAEQILTPPYVSNVPEVFHRRLPRRPHQLSVFVVLCTDGLFDMYHEFGDQTRGGVDWLVSIVTQAIGNGGSNRTNSALALLRDAMGGENINLVSRNLTVEMEEKWLDDTTIVVQNF